MNILENCILILISLKFVSYQVSTENKLSLLQEVVWRQTGDVISNKTDTLSSSVVARIRIQGLYSLSGKTSYRQISPSLEDARLDVTIIVSL